MNATMQDPSSKGASQPPGSRSGRKLRVLIVDDHPVVREGLKLQIDLQDDMEVCGEAEDVQGALELLTSTAPDVAVVDLTLKSGHGLDLIHRVRERNDPVRVLAWSAHPEWLYADRALAAGAAGYVHKGRATREILDGIRCVIAGRIYVSSEVTERLMQGFLDRRGRAGRAGVDSLSDRELRVFELIGAGASTKQIAARLNLSCKTVETYRTRIKLKLSVESSRELTQLAVRHVLEKSGPGRPPDEE